MLCVTVTDWQQGAEMAGRPLPGVSYCRHPIVAVLHVLRAQLQSLLVVMVEADGEVVLWRHMEEGFVRR